MGHRARHNRATEQQPDGLFSLLPLLPNLWYIKESDIQALTRWLFLGASMPSSWLASSRMKSLHDSHVAGRKTTVTPGRKLFLWLAFHFFYYYNPTQCVAWKTLTLCLTFYQLMERWFVCAHLWIEEINTPLPKAGHSLGDVLQDWRPFHFSSPLHLPLYSAFLL